MNTSKAKKTSKKAEGAQERQFAEIRTCEVKNVRVVDGKNGDLVFFTLTINDVTIYNCRVATGKNGDFISFPQYKAPCSAQRRISRISAMRRTSAVCA